MADNQPNTSKVYSNPLEMYEHIVAIYDSAPQNEGPSKVKEYLFASADEISDRTAYPITKDAKSIGEIYQFSSTFENKMRPAINDVSDEECAAAIAIIKQYKNLIAEKKDALTIDLNKIDYYTLGINKSYSAIQDTAYYAVGEDAYYQLFPENLKGGPVGQAALYTFGALANSQAYIAHTTQDISIGGPTLTKLDQTAVEQPQPRVTDAAGTTPTIGTAALPIRELATVAAGK